MYNVALIDDDAVFCDVFSRQLNRRKIAITHFQSISIFFETATASLFDAIVVDLDMEDVSGETWEYAGLEAVKALKSAGTQTPPVLVLTGHLNPMLSRTAKNNGADGFVSKDWDISEIADEIKGEINQGEVRQRVTL